MQCLLSVQSLWDYYSKVIFTTSLVPFHWRTSRMVGLISVKSWAQLTDLWGQVLVDKQVLVEQATHQERLSLGGAGAGLYLLRVSTAGQTSTLKVLKGQ